MPEQFQKIIDNLTAFGPRRTAIGGGILAFVFAVVIGGAIFLNRPANETLYVGLDRSDVAKIGVVLGEAGLSYDVGADGTTVMVARALGRTGIGIDLSADYLRLADWRIHESGHAAKTIRRTNQERQGSLL